MGNGRKKTHVNSKFQFSTAKSVHQVISRVKKERLQQKSRAREFLEAQHGWYASFMHQLLEKLADFGGAENIMFDWWTVDSESKTETDTDDETDKAKIQQILLMLCCKVRYLTTSCKKIGTQTLLCLGDICRYQHDLFPGLYSNKLSYRYYMQGKYELLERGPKSCSAWHMDPANGMPWNNVGSLMQNNYHGVYSVFFYRRCLQVR